jgi:hypothetical protein
MIEVYLPMMIPHLPQVPRDLHKNPTSPRLADHTACCAQFSHHPLVQEKAHLNFDERVGLSPGICAGALKGYFSGVRFVSLSHALRDTDKVLKTF